MKYFFNNRINFLIILAGIYALMQFLLRWVFLLFSRYDVSWNPLILIKTFLLGICYDSLVWLYLLIPMALVLLWGRRTWLDQGWLRRILKGMLYCFGIFAGFILISEIYFWEEFHTRYNFIAVDYLIYTQELFGNIFESYNLFLLFGSVSLTAGGLIYLFRRYLPKNFDVVNWRQTLGAMGIYAGLLVGGTFLFTSNAAVYVADNVYNQEIARNGVYQFVYAFFNNELDYNRFYLHDEDEKVLAALRGKIALDGGVFVNRHDMTRNITNKNQVSGLNPNICVIVVESLSSKFTGMDGNTNSLTPYLDTLTQKGYAYTNVYATGTRTVRGLEAVTLSLPPTPGQSILRRPDCLNFHTVGTELKGHGYATEFIYGGYGYFDNMNAFFEGNEFDVYDRNTIPSEKIFNDTVWGVADEILFDQVLERLDIQYREQEPVFQVVLTTTNHRPFTFPEGRINAPQGVRESVVLYTDWAINNFLEKAATKPWFANTVFVILADHNALAAGRVNLPISNYKIPCLIYAPRLIPNGACNRLMSQIDVLPTVLGMLGFSYQSKNLGYDINKLPKGEERIFISTYQQMGFVKGNKLAVLSPGNKGECYKIKNFATSDYEKIPQDEDLLEEAVTWYQGANVLYKQKLMKK